MEQQLVQRAMQQELPRGDEPAYGRWDPRRITGGAALYPLVVLFGLNAVDELDRAAFNVLLPEIRDSFGLSNQEALSFVAATTPVILAGGLLLAYYADRVRRTHLAAGGAAVWAGFSALTGFAPNVAVLGVARVGSGVGKAVNDPTHGSLLADYYPLSVRANVFAAHRVANSVGNILGPVLAGVLAVVLSWRAPFLLFALPTALLVALALRLPEPKRGGMERRAAGVDEARADVEDAPPSFAESIAIIHAIPSLRRIYFSLPFLAGSLIGLQSVLALFYEDVFEVGEAARGVIFALDEPFQIAGLVVGAPIAQRLMRKDPALALRFLTAVICVVGVTIFLIAVAPNLAWAIGAGWIRAFAASILTPALLAMNSLIIPPRARSVGYALTGIYVIPGILLLPMIGAVGDNVGLRPAMMLLLPVYLCGGLVIMTAARFINGDIERNLTELSRDRGVVQLRSADGAVYDREVGDGPRPVLEMHRVDFSYGDIQCLYAVNFAVQPGSRVAVLGTNGSGKSTLLRVAAGLLPPGSGHVYFQDRNVTHMPAEERARLGLTLIEGGKGVFPSLTVEENLRISAHPFLDARSEIDAREEEVLELFPALRARFDQRAGTLSGGEQQMVAIGRALMTGTRFMMIDELSLGLAPVILEDLLRVVDDLASRGTTIIMVEQSLTMALDVADDVYFMERGELSYLGPSSDLGDRDRLEQLVLFGHAGHQDAPPPRRRPRGAGTRERRPTVSR